MNMQNVRDIAKQLGLKTSRLSKVELIHQIQRTEGNFDCFGKAVSGYCDQDGCVWRKDCLTLAKKDVKTN